jgi:hypothetical protein
VTTDGFQHGGGHRVDQLQIERPLGIEVLIEQGLGHPGRFGRVVHGGGVVAPFGEQGERHIEQLLATPVGRQPLGRRAAVVRCA